MRNNLLMVGLVAVAAFVVLSRNEQVVATDDLDRTRLPIAQPAPTPVTEALPENVPLPTPWEVKAPEGAPNVVIATRRHRIRRTLALRRADQYAHPAEAC